MRKVFGVPVFYDTDKLLEHIQENNDMPSQRRGWSDVTNEKAWELAYESGAGDLLYVEDQLQRETGDGQSTLTTDYWGRGRYTVNLRPGYAPSDAASALEKTFDAFDFLDDAEAYVEGLLTEL